MKCFVAGGTGVIGRRVVPLLVAAGHDVRVVARSPERADQIRAAGAEPVSVDLFDRAAVDAAVVGAEAVVNLATHIPPMSRSALASAWVENDRIRSEGAPNLAGAAMAAGAVRLVQESITFPYADGGSDWVTESAARPPSPFTSATDVAERATAAFTEAGGSGVVLRFAQFAAADASHIATFAKMLRRGLFPIPGDRDAYTSFIGIDGAARAVIAALEAPPGTYNIADDDPVTRGEIAIALAEALGRRPGRFLPPGLVRRANSGAEVLMRSHRIDNRAFAQATGWAPGHRGAESITAAIALAYGVRRR